MPAAAVDTHHQTPGVEGRQRVQVVIVVHGCATAACSAYGLIRPASLRRQEKGRINAAGEQRGAGPRAGLGDRQATEVDDRSAQGWPP